MSLTLETPSPVRPAAAPVGTGRRPADLVAIAVPAVLLAVVGWRRRWITDDGLIFTRVVRQIEAGNGPVYSPGERAETATSTAWQWLLVPAHQISPFGAAETAVYLGLALSAAGFALATDGTRRLHRTAGTRALLLPAGACVFVAVPAVWDFLTAGMETGLIIVWIGGLWWLLVAAWARTAGPPTRGQAAAVAFVGGFGPLIRPDLLLTSLVFLAALALLTAAGPRRCALLAAAAGALPLAYEVFRMGYYGLLVPMPAVTKEAGTSAWGRGWDYLTDYNRPYSLWIPLALLAAVAAIRVLRRGTGPHVPAPRTADAADSAAVRARRTRIVIAAPVVAALVQTFFLIKVGGDFMHGRMWLPILLLLLLPMLLVPFHAHTAPLVAGVVVWAVVCGATMRPGFVTTPSPAGGADGVQNQVWNERTVYRDATRETNPVSAQAHIAYAKKTDAVLAEARAEGRRVLLFDPAYIQAFGLPEIYWLPLRPDLPQSVGFVIGRLGLGGAVAPLDGLVADVWGLSSTIGSHIEQTNFAAAGHQKLLPTAWNIALYVDPAAFPGVPANLATQEQIRAAHRTLGCGPVRDLVASVTEPMSVSRFWKNLTGAYDRTKLRIPADPIAAERKFCPPAPGAPRP